MKVIQVGSHALIVTAKVQQADVAIEEAPIQRKCLRLAAVRKQYRAYCHI